MEYPKLDRRLHLLMLMHRSLEEARLRGDDEPRLGFREDTHGLTVRVEGTDDAPREELGVGEIRHENADAGDLLRGLESDGYVELRFASSGPSSGTVAVTEKGLAKIGYRKAFEANLPRSTRTWEASLLGGPRIGVTQEWRAVWEGHDILVENRLRLTSGEHEGDVTESLRIDGRVAQLGVRLSDRERRLAPDPMPSYVKEPQPWRSKDLYGELRAKEAQFSGPCHEPQGNAREPWGRTAGRPRSRKLDAYLLAGANSYSVFDPSEAFGQPKTGGAAGRCYKDG